MIHVSDTFVICFTICFILLVALQLYNNSVIKKRHSIIIKYFEEQNKTAKAIQIIQLLQEDFPALFTKKPKAKKALKIGIYKGLIPWARENKFALNYLDEALHLWTTGKRYRNALETGKRYDLKGNQVN